MDIQYQPTDRSILSNLFSSWSNTITWKTRQDLLSIRLACRRCFDVYHSDYHFMYNIWSVFYTLFRSFSDTPSRKELLDRFFRNQLTLIGQSDTSRTYKTFFRHGLYEMLIKEIKLDYFEQKEKKDELISLAIDSYIHEYIVGVTTINELRRIIPTFCFTYLFISEDNSSSSTTTTMTTQLMIEYIKGITFSQYLKNMVMKPITEEDQWEFLTIYIQLMLSLNVAQEQYLWTHYDLHGNNVLIQELDQPKDLHYPSFHGTYLLKNVRKIPVIIDYGHVSTQNASDMSQRWCLPNTMDKFGKHRYYMPSYDSHEWLISMILSIHSHEFPSHTMGYWIKHMVHTLMHTYYNLQFDHSSQHGYVPVSYYKENHGKFYTAFLHDYVYRPSIYLVKVLDYMSSMPIMERSETKENEPSSCLRDPQLWEHIPFVYRRTIHPPMIHQQLFKHSFQTTYRSISDEEDVLSFSERTVQLITAFSSDFSHFHSWKEDLYRLPPCYQRIPSEHSDISRYLEWESHHWNWTRFLQCYDALFSWIKLNPYPAHASIPGDTSRQKGQHLFPINSTSYSHEQLFEHYSHIMTFLVRSVDDIVCLYHKYQTLSTYMQQLSKNK